MNILLCFNFANGYSPLDCRDAILSLVAVAREKKATLSHADHPAVTSMVKIAADSLDYAVTVLDGSEPLQSYTHGVFVGAGLQSQYDGFVAKYPMAATLLLKNTGCVPEGPGVLEGDRYRRILRKNVK